MKKNYQAKNGDLIFLKSKKKKKNKNVKNKREIYNKEVHIIYILEFSNRINRINFKSESKKEIKKFVIDKRSNTKDESKHSVNQKNAKILRNDKKNLMIKILHFFV